MTEMTIKPVGTGHRTINIDLELELDYVGLTDQEIKGRCSQDEDTIVEAINRGERPVLPACLKAFRFMNYGETGWFRHDPEPNTVGS